MIGQDDVARLLPADVAALLAHFLENVAVADPGTNELQAFRFEPALEPQVGHDGCDQGAALKLAAAMSA